LNQSIVLFKELRNSVNDLKIWALSVMMLLQEKLSWMNSYRIFQGNSKKEQDPRLIKRPKRELKKFGRKEVGGFSIVRDVAGANNCVGLSRDLIWGGEAV
jgi:hypothetical protein